MFPAFTSFHILSPLVLYAHKNYCIITYCEQFDTIRLPTIVRNALAKVLPINLAPFLSTSNSTLDQIKTMVMVCKVTDVSELGATCKML